VVVGSAVGSGRVMASQRGLRLAYASSVVLLVVLALATLASPLLLPALRTGQAPLPEAGKLQVLAKADEWILEYHLTNSTASDGTYTFVIAGAASAPVVASGVATDRTVHTTSVLVTAGHSYGFIYHLRLGEVPDGPVRFTIDRAGDAAPLEDVTLHLTPQVGGR
jgi:hypothetical protein